MHLSELEQVRKARLDKIRELNVDPYGCAIQDVEKIGNLVDNFKAGEPLAPNPDNLFYSTPHRAQGRIVLRRDNGGLIWFKIRDDSGEIQVAFSKKSASEPENFALAKLTDLGDIITVDGPIRRTQTGEITIWASRIYLACKSLAHPPDKVEGLQDVEIRYRQRYLDMAFNGDFTRRLQERSRIISLLRKAFEGRRYIEVETPMLHPIAGGAAARPFATHLNALDIPLFMRIAPELYLKRLIVGGMSRVFEINRNFRNEGVDATHNPEFTALEAYGINETAQSLMMMVEEIIKEVVFSIDNTPHDHQGIFKFGEHLVDFNQPFRVVSFKELFQRGVSKDILQETDFIKANKLFEEFCEPLIDPNVPTFVYGYPSAISPLTKTIAGAEVLSQRADLFIGGMEIGTIYTEQNDPQVQFDVFNQQLSDDEESTHRTMDTDFVEALKVGMPPTGGLGIGVDRLVMLLTGQTSVRDVIAFPFMRPLEVPQNQG